MKIKIVFSGIILLVLLTVTGWAESVPNGLVKGKIKDANTGNVLPYANIAIKGTSKGSSADINGEYSILLPEGSYILKITYLGYKTEEIEITVESKITQNLNIMLTPANLSQDTILIMGQSEGQIQAIKEQLNSTSIKSVLSITKLREVPGANAAESVAKLPGITLLRQGSEGAYVVIRGLAPQYNQVTIDGVQLPANFLYDNGLEDIGDRAVNISMISSSMLGGLEVIKAITPDMDAEAIGGVVNFQSRKAAKNEFNKPSFEIFSQDVYNHLRTSYSNYYFHGIYEQRIFDQSLGIFLLGSAQKQNLSTNLLEAGYILEDKKHGDDGIPLLSNVDLTDNYNVNNRYGVSLVLDYEHKTGEIALRNYFNKDIKDITKRNQSLTTNNDDIYYSISDSRNIISTIGNLISIKQDIPIFHIDLNFSHSLSEASIPEILRFNFGQSRGIPFGNWTAMRPKDFLEVANPNTSRTIFYGYSTGKIIIKNQSLLGKIDLQTEFEFLDISSQIKFGGMFLHTERTVNQDNTGGFPSTEADLYLISQKFPGWEKYRSVPTITNFIDHAYSFEDFMKGDYKMYFPVSKNIMRNFYNSIGIKRPAGFDKHYSIMNDYNGIEEKSAAYLMGTFSIGESITFVPGIRYQNLISKYFAYQAVYAERDYQYSNRTTKVPHGYLLPMLHVKYSPLNWLQVHFAYTNTLSYPSYKHIIPTYQISQPQSAYIRYNNHLLKPATSENYDLVLSFTKNEIGYLSATAFKKRIKNLSFEATWWISDLSNYPDLPQNRKQLFTINTIINSPIPVDVWGLEAEWQTNLWYLPKPFSGLNLNLNYTHIFSKATYPKYELAYIYYEDGSYTPNVLDKSYKDRLLYQPNDILNFSVSYNYSGFSAGLSVLFTSNIFYQPAYWMQERVISDRNTYWDLFLNQELPWYRLKLFFNLFNLTDEDVTKMNQKTGYPNGITRYGLTGNLGVSITF